MVKEGGNRHHLEMRMKKKSRSFRKGAGSESSPKEKKKEQKNGREYIIMAHDNMIERMSKRERDTVYGVV